MNAGFAYGFISFWARNSVAANLLMVLAFVCGIWGYTRLEKESFPSGSWNDIDVSIAWPGASPKEVEEQLTTRVEEAVADLDGIEEMVSTSREGSAIISMEVRANADIGTLLDDVKGRVDAINNLPEEALRPSIVRSWRGGEYIGVVLYGDIDLRELKRICKDIRDEMSRLPGGDRSELRGALDEEVTIELSERTMRSYGIDFNTIANAIRASSFNASGGKIKADTGAVNLQVRSLADTREQFEDIIVRQTVDGGIIRIKDIAKVRDGFVDYDMESRFKGLPAVFIMFKPPEHMNLPKYSGAMEDYIKEKNKTLPEALTMEILWSDNHFMSEMMKIVSSSALIGIVLVLLLLVLFLRPIVAFWVAVGIATTFAGGFALLPYLGVSLNILAVFGCLLTVGVVVDDAIIIGENIHSRVETKQKGGLENIIAATHEVSRPVIFGVLTTMIAFAPWALLSGPERQFTKHLTLTVIAALTFSLIEAFCVLPNHLSHIKPQKPHKHSRILALQGKIANSLLWFANRIYRPVLVKAVHYRYITVAIFVSLFLLAIGLVTTGHVRGRFMPEIEGNLIYAHIELPDGTPFSRVLELRDRLEEAIDVLIAETNAKYPEIKDQIIEGGSVVALPQMIESWVGLSDPDKRPRNISTKQLSERLRDLLGPIPDAEEVKFQFGMNAQDDGLRFSLSHDDLDILQSASMDLRRKLQGYASTYDVGDSISSPGDEARFSLKPGAEALGVTLQQVGRQVRQAYYGEEIQRLPRDGEDVRVMVKLPEKERKSLDSLRDFRIRTNDGREIPLIELVEIEYVPGIEKIQHRERRRSVAVFAEVRDNAGDLISKEIGEFLPELTQKYPGLTIEEVGNKRSEREFMSEVSILQLIAFVAMYVMLAIAFGSYFQPLLIMTAIPFGFAGAVFGHLVFDVPLALFSMFGIAAAAGVVINDNLVLLDRVNRMRADGAGAMEALVEGGVGRFRPVFLTSLTTIVGIGPMLFDRSVQAQFLKPMVLSLASAVGFALLVTLFFVPALYAVGAEIRRRLVWLVLGQPYISIGSRYSPPLHEDGDPQPVGQPAG